MAQKHPIELFMPPNMLRAKLGGGGFSGMDEASIRRAEAAMEGIKGEFAAWAADDIEKLVAARARFAKMPDAASRAALLRAAHDMKGQAATFNYPLIARVCGSLSGLIGELPADRELPPGLIDAHVSAVQVFFRDKVMDQTNTLALALCVELEAQAARLLKR